MNYAYVSEFPDIIGYNARGTLRNAPMLQSKQEF